MLVSGAKNRIIGADHVRESLDARGVEPLILLIRDQEQVGLLLEEVARAVRRAVVNNHDLERNPLLPAQLLDIPLDVATAVGRHENDRDVCPFLWWTPHRHGGRS